MALQELEDAARVLERRVDLRRLAVLELAAVGAVGLLADDRALLALAAGGVHLHPLVLPGLDVVGAFVSGRSREKSPSRSSVSRNSSLTIVGAFV